MSGAGSANAVSVSAPGQGVLWIVDIGLEGRREFLHEGSITASLLSTPAKCNLDYPVIAVVIQAVVHSNLIRGAILPALPLLI